MRGWGAHEVRLIVVESVVASIELARQAIHLLAVWNGNGQYVRVKATCEGVKTTFESAGENWHLVCMVVEPCVEHVLVTSRCWSSEGRGVGG